MEEREYQERLRNGTLPIITTYVSPCIFPNLANDNWKPIELALIEDKPYGESPLAEFRNYSVKLPCGCNVSDVPQWTEAMYHITHPESCPSTIHREQS